MLSVSQACSNKAKLEVAFDEGILTVWHNPAVFTCEFESQLQKDADDSRPSVFLVNTLSKMILSWDLVDDDGQVIPTDADSLSKLPMPIIIKVSNAISSSHDPTEKPAKNDDAPTPSGSF